MPEKERRLGKGLESLITAARERTLTPDVAGRLGHRVQAIPVDVVEPNPFQPRKEFALDALNELVDSLRHHGLLQPIVVRRVGGKYQLIAGERRWRAMQELGWTQTEAVVVAADDRRMLEWAVIENLQRQALGPIELAEAYRRMASEFQMTHEEIAREVGQSRSTVANTVRLLDLPEELKERVSRGTLAPGAARALLTVSDREAQRRLAERIEKEDLSVRQVEDLARGAKAPSPAGRSAARPDPNLKALAEELQREWGMKVAIKGSLRRGTVVFSYFSQGELDRFVQKLRGQDDDPQEMESDSLTV